MQIGYILSSLIFTKKYEIEIGFANSIDKIKPPIFSLRLKRIKINIYSFNPFKLLNIYSSNINSDEYLPKENAFIILGTLLFYLMFLFVIGFIGYFNIKNCYYNSLNELLILIGFLTFIPFISIFFLNNLSISSRKLIEINKYRNKGYSNYVALMSIVRIFDYYKNDEKLYNKVINYYKNIEKYKNELSLDSINKIYMFITVALKVSKKFDEAEQIYKEFLNIIEIKLKSNKNSIDEIAFIKNISLYMGDYLNCIKYCDLALSSICDQKDKYIQKVNDLLVSKSYSLIFLGEYEKSLEISEKILEKDVKNIENLNNIGLAKIRQGKLEKGLEYINKALVFDNNNANLYYSFGVYYYDKNEYLKSFESFKKSKELSNYLFESDKYIEELNKILNVTNI